MYQKTYESGWDVDGDGTLVGDELVDGPLSARETLLEDLGPDSSLAVGGSVTEVDHDWSLVRSSNRLIVVALSGGTVVVVPLHGDGRASSDLDLIGGSLSAIADHGSRGNIENGVVAVGRSLDSEVLALVLSANDEALESCVSSNEVGSSQGESSGGLHVDFG